MSLLVVGDIDFGASPGKAGEWSFLHAAGERQGEVGTFGPLEGTRAEVLAIKDSFQRRFPRGVVTELRKGEPTEGAVRGETPRHRYLHFATHGFFAPPHLKSALRPAGQKGPGGTRPVPEGGLGRRGKSGYHPGLLSGLALAGANRVPQPGEDDGVLTALEVAELDLTRVELAVLSACETGLGEAAGGEGLLGLQRAFQMAGAKSVVASLWQVPDKATQLLMQRFYDNLWKKRMGRLAALREAQLWLLREGAEQLGRLRGGLERPGPRLNGPLPSFYWAAFVLSGEWR